MPTFCIKKFIIYKFPAFLANRSVVVLILIQSFQVLCFTKGGLEFMESRVYEEDERLNLDLTLYLKIQE